MPKPSSSLAGAEAIAPAAKAPKWSDIEASPKYRPSEIEPPVPGEPRSRRPSAVNNPSPPDFPRETPEQYRLAMEGRLRTLRGELDNPAEHGTDDPAARAAVEREVNEGTAIIIPTASPRKLKMVA